MSATAPTIERVRITLLGAVQGVGFRPTVYRLASFARLGGWVRNTDEGLEIEVEGNTEQLNAFLKQLDLHQPTAAHVLSRELVRLAPQGASGFEILSSSPGNSAPNTRATSVLPDLATCPECLRETLDPHNRRFGYAFTNCTLCGPRYTIQSDIPYDRQNTTMKHFTMCSACRHEYDAYGDRRFHAQPNACPACGPHVQTWPEQPQGMNPIASAVAALAEGKIVALKGRGGYQLLVDARNQDAVMRLRARKHRDEKPFAMLMSSIDEIQRYCTVSEEEREILLSQAAPIVLLESKGSTDLAPAVSQASPYLGVMLPSTPLHHLLMKQTNYPLVATSGNRSGEPILVTNKDAGNSLHQIADLFLMHNRLIARPCDDSVVRAAGGLQILRRARGYAPLPIQTPYNLRPVLAVGGHLKNTVAISLGRQVYLSQHIGDLDSLESRNSFTRAIDDLCRLYRFQPEAIVSDLHPAYASTLWAQRQSAVRGLPLVQVQHHHAHIAACAAENGLEHEYLGVAWDGTGLGLDASIWGGEFFKATPKDFERIAHLQPFPLPGGEAAIRDCSRAAAGLLWRALGEDESAPWIDPSLAPLLRQDVYTVQTSSVGRLFDAVAFLTGVATHNAFEGQAAMALEYAIGKHPSQQSYEITLHDHIADVSEMLRQILEDIRTGREHSWIAARFHNALVNWLLAVAQRSGMDNIVLSGGVFQNAYLISRAQTVLRANGFQVHTPHHVPANDGGLAFGQAILAGRA